MNIAIVDDQTHFREGLKHIFSLNLLKSLSPSVSTFSSYEIETLKKGPKPDFVLLDVTYKYQRTFPLISYFVNNNVSVVVFTNEVSKEVVMDCIRAGVKGYLLKSMNTKEILSALAIIINGGTYLHHFISGILIDEYNKT